MQGRLQRTIRRSAEATGIGFLTGRDIAIRFLPAEPDEGILFRRTDCPRAEPIPARIEFAVPRQRRTAIARGDVVVEMTEHVMAALAGLQIDNCIVELDAPEPPGFDGSSLEMARLLVAAGIVEQDAPRRVLALGGSVRVTQAEDQTEIVYRSVSRPTLAITYHLDYGPRSAIPAQERSIEITPETFLSELAFARTFLLEREADALRKAGYGSRTTFKDLLIFGPDGPIDNDLRASDECARHKILDCLGDFALLGCDVHGHFTACRSGHRLNGEMVRALVARASGRDESAVRRAA